MRKKGRKEGLRRKEIRIRKEGRLGRKERRKD
jgi:hypothetical protein